MHIWGRAGKTIASWLAWERRAAPVLRSIEEGYKKTPPREPNEAQLAIVTSRPELDDLALGVVQLGVEAWHDLDTCRPIGMIAGKIPWTAIDIWTQRQQDLDDEARSIIAQAIRYVDDQDFAERAKIQTRKPTPPPRGRVAPASQGADR